MTGAEQTTQNAFTENLIGLSNLETFWGETKKYIDNNDNDIKNIITDNELVIASSLCDLNNKVDNIKLLTSLSYNALKELRDNSQLIPGRQYRITDYVTTTIQDETQSAGHPFDVIVTADSENTLNENAKAIAHDGDDYFVNSNIEAWELKYCIDNDTERFEWAAGDDVIVKLFYYDPDNDIYNLTDNIIKVDKYIDDTYVDGSKILYQYWLPNGISLDLTEDGQFYDEEAQHGSYIIQTSKGVIYYMKDEYNNECPYDFKNIKFLDSNDNYCFTFGGSERDVSLTGNCYNNVIKENYYDVYNNEFSSRMHLNMIIFGIDCYNNSFGTDCCGISFGNNCYGNSFGNSCHYNSFGNGCYKHSFGTDCNYNSFGDSCNNNSFGSSCHENSFGNFCNNNSFGDSCNNNSFETECYDNSFGNSCDDNSFGTECYNNSFESSCDDNSFGNSCFSNSFGINCNGNSFGSSCHGNSFGSSCDDNSFGNNCVSNSFEGYCCDNSFGSSCDDNSFGNNCVSNSFGNDCYNNSFGSSCDNNFFENSCVGNSFGINCNDNSFGNYCYDNSFGNNCYNNSFGTSCSDNSFGNYYYGNSFENDCYYNSFGNGCYNNSFGRSCNDNSFGNGCNDNSFGGYCYANSFANYCRYNSIELNYTKCCHLDDNCSFIELTTDQTVSSNYSIANVNINRGVKGISTSNKEVVNIDKLNADYEINVYQFNDALYIAYNDIFKVTYDELVEIRSNSQLIPGKQYRITDYVTRSGEINTISAEHQFDIIVTADDERTLNENARAVQNSNDGYFASFDSCNLSAWELKYCLDNDENRFAWVGREMIEIKKVPTRISYDTSNCTIKSELVDGNSFIDPFLPEAFVWVDPSDSVIQYNDTFDESLFYEFGYEVEPNGTTENLCIYKSSEEYYEEEGTDYVDKYFYRGIKEVDGEEYDYWQKCESKHNSNIFVFGITDTNDDGIDDYKYILTNRIVDGTPVTTEYKPLDNIDIEYRIYIDENGDSLLTDADYSKNYKLVSYGYELDNNGVRTLVTYRTDVSLPEEPGGTDFSTAPDYEIPCFYVGTTDVDGITYDKWRVISDDWNWEWTDNQQYYLTQQIVENGAIKESAFAAYGNEDFVYGDINGKGVIYYMKDEWGNECPYDFKNIMFKHPLNEDDTNYYYTFGGNSDRSLDGNCHHNVIKDYIVSTKYHLNRIIFGTNCNGNSFGNDCNNNSFGNDCNNNSFGNDCNRNSFGNNCNENTFGNYCSGNSFGNNCDSISFRNYCHGNSFGNYCQENTFGNYCRYNSIESSYTKYCYLDDGCSYIELTTDQTISSNNSIINVNIDRGVEGISLISKKVVNIDTLNAPYEIKVANNSKGELKIYCEADLIA